MGCVPTVIITFFLIVFFSIFQWPLLNNFDRIIEKGKKNKDSLTKKDIAQLMSLLYNGKTGYQNTRRNISYQFIPIIDEVTK